MKVLISGAGIGGLTLGAFFERFDINYDIVEKGSSSDSQGYSLGMWDNGRDILKKLGIESKFDTQGVQMRWFSIKDGKGNTLKRYNLKDFYARYGSAYTHINREDLHSWLMNEVGEDQIKYLTTISDIEQNKRAKVTLSDGSLGNYDVVVGADGVHSNTREIVFTDQSYEKFEDWRAWYVWIDNSFEEGRTVKEYIEPSQFISVFDDGDRTLAVMLAPVSHKVCDEKDNRIERLSKLFPKQTELVPDILHGVDPSDIMPTDLSVVEMNKWHKGSTVLLGDAAHAMEPFGGLGASMAMEDAYVLAGELLKCKQGQKSLSEAFHDYQIDRKDRVERAREATQKMRWWALSQSSIFNYLLKKVIPVIPEYLFTKNLHELMREEI